eukprot:gnl/TRDRNA2_/TRDRNA2_82529_c0_seq2.p1 gnl/TRDRNA2_/TRDRNA2_82529_c0~~gnl/TRDRNA2_/TRDRNA2_82529_c0_seq2.p1  ORF type:complete len:249 (-),score=26.82 gnl/TRDRNA2_/TRDRNA2_82529_c0_seq2:241-987(-)
MAVPKYQKFVKYKDSLSQTLSSYNAAAPSAKILLMKSHWICDRKYDGDYGRVVQLIQKSPNDVIAACVANLQMQLLRENVTDDFRTIKDTCSHSIFTNSGVSYLNEQLLEVANSQEHANIPISVVDLFALTTNMCDYTSEGDGIHYTRLVFDELLAMCTALLGDSRAVHQIRPEEARTPLPRVHYSKGFGSKVFPGTIRAPGLGKSYPAVFIAAASIGSMVVFIIMRKVLYSMHIGSGPLRWPKENFE